MIFYFGGKIKNICFTRESISIIFLLKSLKDMAEQEKVRNIDFYFSKYNFCKRDKTLIINDKNTIKQIE